MRIITIDWETYYSKEYSLTKMSTEAYIRDPRFQVIMLGIRMPDGTRGTITGTHEEIKYKLDAIPWHEYAVLAHNTMFDAAIMTWVFGIKPALWLDTLSMANAIHHGKPNSLEKLAERYNQPRKLDYILNALGKRREDFTPDEFRKYAIYCLRDVDLCYNLFQIMSEGWYDLESCDMRGKYPRKELELIDAHIRMFTEPRMRLNSEKLKTHLADVQERKEKLLSASGIAKEDLMSNPKFAGILESFGVAPPLKVSPTTKKVTYAFAKTDEGMKALLEHPDERVQAVVAARMGVKSTLEETRTERFIAIAERGLRFPIPLKYYAAHTGRSGGTDKVNLQNLPSRGQGAGKLKECMEFPPGHIGCNSDSSNIEARMLAWWAMQDDLVADFAAGVDVYCKLATTIYGFEVTKANALERFVGKTVTLGCGYQTGATKLQVTMKAATPPVDMPMQECERIINIYRQTNYKIKELWAQAEKAIQAMHDDHGMWLGREGVVWVDGKRGIKLPNGMYIQYPQLHKAKDKETGRDQWYYKGRYGVTSIYGGKLVENVTQALARIVVMYQLLKIRKRYPVALTVHDSVVALAKMTQPDPLLWDEKKEIWRANSQEAKDFQAYVEDCMRWIPKWAAGCPIDCESGLGFNYGEC